MTTVSSTKCKKCDKVDYIQEFEPDVDYGHICMNITRCDLRRAKVASAHDKPEESKRS